MAAHLEEQQELDNFKYFWKRTGRWIFALLIVAALGYLGYTIYQGQKSFKRSGSRRRIGANGGKGAAKNRP